MKVAFVEKYGPPETIRIIDVPTPEIGDSDVLISMRATTVNSGDARMRALRVPKGLGLLVRLGAGWSAPKKPIQGFEVAGEVSVIGRNVTKFKVGDRVLASNGFEFGCQAEFVKLPQDGVIAHIPDSISYEDAAALPFGGITSQVFFDLGKLKKGDSILINGASGAVGVMAIQLAKHRGAHVTAVCSTDNTAFVQELGADHVIDYTQHDFTKLGKTYDVIMDNHGNAPYSKVKHLLKPGGRFLQVIATLWEMITSIFNKAITSAGENRGASDPKAFDELLALVEEGIIKPVIGNKLPFDQIVEAHRIVDSGHKRGSLVLTLAAS